MTTSCASEAQKHIDAELLRTNKALDAVLIQYDECLRDMSAESFTKLSGLAYSLDLNVDEGGYKLNTSQKLAILSQRHLIDSVRKKVAAACSQFVKTTFRVILNEDALVEGVKSFPFYLKRGTKVIIRYSPSEGAEAKYYNADSRKLLRTYSVGACTDSLFVENSAIYLFEVTSKTPQYCNIQILQRVSSLDEFLDTTSVSVSKVEAKSGDFRTRKVPGIRMKNIFEEPHKITVRSKLKYFMDPSSPYRTIATVKIPSGSTDLLYHLRISTDDSGSSHDGQFCGDVYNKYNKIKFLGLPLYESSRTNNSIFRELLSGLFVQREEKAYCNLYIFTNASQARRFQESADISKLAYDMDYSIMGTQSINERIPVKGGQTIYLGIENTRQRYDLYLWLEALAAIPQDLYYTEKYSLGN